MIVDFEVPDETFIALVAEEVGQLLTTLQRKSAAQRDGVEVSLHVGPSRARVQAALGAALLPGTQVKWGRARERD